MVPPDVASVAASDAASITDVTKYSSSTLQKGPVEDGFWTQDCSELDIFFVCDSTGARSKIILVNVFSHDRR